MQHIHTLRVDLHRLSVDDPVVVAGGMGHDAIDLDLDNEWEGLSVVITIGPENRAVSVAYDGEPVTIPAECIDTPGMLPVSVTGYGEDGTVRVTTEQDCRLTEGARVSVYIKAILPERMKIKLLAIDTLPPLDGPAPLEYFITQGRLEKWKYAPPGCVKVGAETVFA